MLKKSRLNSFQSMFIVTVCVFLACCAVFSEGKPVLDRSKLGSLITSALNQYYKDNGKYPPHLYGDVTNNVYNSEAPGFGFKPISRDPLIEGGYLSKYPLAYTSPIWLRWSCAFSTPYDRVRMEKNGQEINWAEYLQSQWEQLHWRPSPDLSTSQIPQFSARYYTLGGRELSHGRKVEFMAPEYRYSLHSTTSLHFPRAGLPFFGYQRGEWFEENERSAWVWFYGSNFFSKTECNSSVPRNGQAPNASTTECDTYLIGSLAKGLDVVNAESGQLEEDGIPDGICLLYKLKDGEVVEIVRAEDI